MEKNQYNYYLVIDLEATCCDQKKISRQEMEIIEIGAVMAEEKTLKIINEFQTFIKPIRHSILTPFCTKLTHITQENVDKAPLFCEAITNFKQWLSLYENFIFCSWGNYDKRQIEKDCEYHKIPYPIKGGHINLKERFSQRQNLKNKLGLKQALEYVNLPLDGTHHRGIDDAKNTAKLLPFIFTQ
jgi:inhibitor of KinA sporulation pathway (predicted exonuclease)